MTATTALVALGTQIGPVVANKIVDSLKKSRSADDNLIKVTRLIESGATAVAAFNEVFGKAFLEAFPQPKRSPGNRWNYEASRTDYLRADSSKRSKIPATRLLRDELNINLDRIAQLYGGTDSDVRNYFRGVFSEWMSRYRELLGEDPDSKKTFTTIEALLDGRRRNFADAFKLLQQTSLGTTGAMLVVYAGMLATSTGIGLWAAFTTWVAGVPVLQVGALVVGGALLIALSRVKFGPTNAMSTTVTAAYRLLDRHDAQAG